MVGGGSALPLDPGCYSKPLQLVGKEGASIGHEKSGGLKIARPTHLEKEDHGKVVASIKAVLGARGGGPLAVGLIKSRLTLRAMSKG